MKAKIQNRPIAHQMLTRRQAVRLRTGIVTGQKPPFPRPALLGPRQFGFRARRVGFIRHLDPTLINAAGF
jgi:hypothetical protein